MEKILRNNDKSRHTFSLKPVKLVALNHKLCSLWATFIHSGHKLQEAGALPVSRPLDSPCLTQPPLQGTSSRFLQRHKGHEIASQDRRDEKA